MSNVSSDPMIGRLLDGRYQIRSRIARGGMATVYLATDLRLERRVAVKVMHPHLADDEDYKARFIQEARSSARLAHPNVVNVYDQGQDADTAYLVMEYLPGITLRDLLREHSALTTEQSLDVMEAVLSGLAAAHRSGIVHRDLKPENVLLADDGRIKISDFGLARAASASTATGNALLGTIAYLSPELVTRGIADTRSDIYAAGIMLFEMLTGEQPFKGEQPFQIAHQHANDSVPAPSTLDPDIPAELDELVLWATSREPDERPRDATTMLARLLETQRMLSGDATSTAVLSRTMVLPMAIGSSTDATQVIAPVVPRKKEPRVPDGPVGDLSQKAQKRRGRGVWLLVIVLLLAGLAAGVGWYFGAGPGAAIAVPDVSGTDPATASAELTAQELLVAENLLTEHHPTVPVDVVIGTDPPSGTSVERGSTVSLIVSLGPEQLPVPELVGLNEADALEAVEAARFTAAPSTYYFSPDVPEGIVMQALGADGAALAQTYGDQQPVTLVVSRGAIPDVSGRSVDDAKAALAEVGLTGVESIEEFNNSLAAGLVIRAQPQEGQTLVPDGGSVDLILSKGVEQVAVPDVIGKTWGDAKPILEGAGFSLEYNRLFDGFPGSTVVRTSPEPNVSVDKGSAVRVTLQLQL